MHPNCVSALSHRSILEQGLGRGGGREKSLALHADYFDLIIRPFLDRNILRHIVIHRVLVNCDVLMKDVGGSTDLDSGVEIGKCETRSTNAGQ